MANTIRSQGTEVRIGGTKIGGLNNASLGGVDVNFIDTTAWDSEGGWREFIGGLKDPGTLEMSGNADPSDSGQAKLINNAGEEETFEILLTNGTKFTGFVIIGGYSPNPNEDNAVEFSCTCKCTGPISLGGN